MRLRKTNIFLLLLVIACVCCSSSAGAKEKKVNKQKIMLGAQELETSNIYVNDKGKVSLIKYDSDAAKDKNDNYYTVLDIKQINGKSFSTKHKIKHKMHKNGIINYVRLSDITAIAVEKNTNRYTYITEYDLKGKKIFSFKDKIDTVNRCYYHFGDIWDEGNSIYYVYWQNFFDDNEKSGAVLRCVNKKTGKTLTSKSE